MFTVDPAHAKIDVMQSRMVYDIWKDKYRWDKEADINETFARVAKAIYAKDQNFEKHEQDAIDAMVKGLWIPGGRIIAGAGTSKRVTLMNCYVNGKVPDDMEGIMKHVTYTALTLQQGGGMGTDFSTLRPEGAILTRTHSKASGPLPFMHMWDRTSATVRSAGDRRGAMMGTMCDTHPDLPKFITVKRDPNVLTQFNMSVLVSDAFMEAVRDDEEWVLYFHIPPFDRDESLVQYDFVDEHDVAQFVYAVWRAKDLWKLITENTYEYSEPGVIFIDRVNELNNLQYCEDIRCTNPCVTGDTLILTDKGHLPIKDLVGKKTSVWNGFEWSEVTPFETGENQTYEVLFNNGANIKTTAYHKWPLYGGITKQTSELSRDDELIYHDFPILKEGISYPIDAYSQGFYCGDGTKNSDRSNLYKHSEAIRNRLVGKFWDRNCESQPGHRWLHGEMLPKDFVPVDGDVEYCVNWLAGLLDADGNIAHPSKGSMPVLQITAKNREFLNRIRIMLSRLGVNSRVWERKDAGLKTGSNGKSYMCESTACLMIAGKGSYQLQKLGMKTERVDISWVREPKGIARKGVKVVSVISGTVELTYCLTEPKLNTFIANGVITRNCGEQPLPPHGVCNLGHINLARCVRYPYTAQAAVDYELIRSITRMGIRFLDNVIDVTQYPLEEQEREQFQKRRLGLGFTGLADLLGQVKVRYGSPDAVRITEEITRTICWEAYEASVDLAIEKGPFPMFEEDGYLNGYGFAATMLPQPLRDKIRKHGIRNSLLLTVAPTGTGSIVVGNVSSGAEPVFLHSAVRRVLKPTTGFGDQHETYTEWGYGAKLFASVNGSIPENTPLPPYLVTAEDLSIEEHVVMQAAAQRYIDASISKTINVPKETSYEQFAKVYDLAYSLGCKGCTTYRPSDIRGSVLSKPGEAQTSGVAEKLAERPERLTGATYKIRWPSMSSALYLTINSNEDGNPFEIFIASKDAKYHDWATALTVMITSIFRKGGNISFVAKELQQIESLHDSAFINKQHMPSLVALIGKTLEDHIQNTQSPGMPFTTKQSWVRSTGNTQQGEQCPKCKGLSLIRKEGCKVCFQCDFTSCG